jgi:protein associated with RNAse G/E
MMNGKMFKVLAPITKDGTTHWANLGRGFSNKDQSINVYLETLPLSVFTAGELKLQLREYDDEDLRRRDEYRARKPDGPPPLPPGGDTATLPF